MPLGHLSIRPTPANRLHNLWCNHGWYWVHSRSISMVASDAYAAPSIRSRSSRLSAAATSRREAANIPTYSEDEQ